jgi:hypothetical protein
MFRDFMDYAWSRILACVWAVIGFILLYNLFPLVLVGSSAVNSTSNISMYSGLTEANHIMPAVIFGIVSLSIIGSVIYAFHPKPFHDAANNAKDFFNRQRFDD